LPHVNEVREPGDRTPIVLAGGVLRHCAPLRKQVHERLETTWPKAPVAVAGPGEEGAARLAAGLLTADDRPVTAPVRPSSDDGNPSGETTRW